MFIFFKCKTSKFSEIQKKGCRQMLATVNKDVKINFKGKQFRLSKNDSILSFHEVNNNK